MSHVEPPDAVREIRAAAQTNAAALRSVSAQVTGQIAHVELFPNTPSKGRLRDGLARLKARYEGTAALNDRMVALSTVVLDMLGSESPPDEDPAPPPTTWSTGNW